MSTAWVGRAASLEEVLPDNWNVRAIKLWGAAGQQMLDNMGKDYFFFIIVNPCVATPEAFPGACPGPGA